MRKKIYFGFALMGVLALVGFHFSFKKKSTDSGRFLIPKKKTAAIKVPRVNLRSGPGKGHPIIWVLRLPNAERGARWPVLLGREKDHWYWITDAYGTSGWINGAMLVFSPFFIVRAGGCHMSKFPQEGAPPLSFLKAGVCVRWLKGAPNAWALVHHKKTGLKGWVQERFLWP